MSAYFKNIFDPRPYDAAVNSVSFDQSFEKIVGAVSYQVPADERGVFADQYLKYKTFDLLPEDQKTVLRGMVAKLPAPARALLLGQLGNGFALVALGV